MPNLKMKLLPDGYTYSRAFHVMFSALCKSVGRTSTFYVELAKIRRKIKEFGIKELLSVFEEQKADILSNEAIQYFDKMVDELPKVGQELQARTLTYLLSLKGSKE